MFTHKRKRLLRTAVFLMTGYFIGKNTPWNVELKVKKDGGSNG